MARLLGCPHCRAEFTFDDWARATACPACGLRLSFFEASGQAASVPAFTGAAASWGQSADPRPEERRAGVGIDEHDGGAHWNDPGSAATPAPAGAATDQPGAEPDMPQDGGWTWSATEGDGATPIATTAFAAPPSAATAVAAGAVAAPPSAAAVAAAPPSVAPPSSTLPLVSVTLPAAASRPHVYTIGGKALAWSRGWTVVLVIWAIVAVGLVATRVEMGPVTVMTPAESAAIASVQRVKLSTGASTEAVLRYSATHDLTLEGHVATIPAGGTEMWYAFDRPWEHRIYVYTELPGTSMVGKNADLSWTVSDGVARADGATRAALTKAAQTMAHPPSPNSVRPIPGIIPSLPPDLQ